MVLSPGTVHHKDRTAESSLQVFTHAAQHAHARKRITCKGKVLDVRAAALVGHEVHRLLGIARHHAQRSDEVGAGGAERVDLQLGHLVGGDIGVELAQHARDGDGACVVGEDHGAGVFGVQERAADVRVESARGGGGQVDG